MVDDKDNKVTEMVSLYTQGANNDGTYTYTYKNDDGEKAEYVSTVANLKSFAVPTEEKDDEGNVIYKKYGLTAEYETEGTGATNWTFGFSADEKDFYANINIFVNFRFCYNA